MWPTAAFGYSFTINTKEFYTINVVGKEIISSTVSQLFEPQMHKIAVFTYRSPHFCFPWIRPCDYHAMCCMDGKAIQCLPNPSQHVAIYLQ